MKEKLHIKPFAGIVLGLFLLEVVISNWYGLTISHNTNQMLAQDAWTNETGTYETDAIVLDTNVKNVYIALSEDGAEQAEVTFTLTDEGDKYEYSLPTKTVRRDVADSSYVALYPFGEVHTLQVEVKAVADSPVHISSIEVNRDKLFRFHLGRFLIFLGIALFVKVSYTKLCKSHASVDVSFSSETEQINQSITKPNSTKQNGTKQRLLVACTFVLIAVIGWKLVHINPAFVNPQWTHHRQYQELAEVLAKGQVYLDYVPSDGLLQAENPYDTIALQAEQIPYLMDYTFYDGKYYVYFGIVPELMCFLPYYLLTGKHLANWQVIYIFYLLFVIGVFGLIREMFILGKKKVTDNPALYVLLTIAVCFLPNYVYILTRPDMYHIPIMSATAFLTLSLFLFLAGIRMRKKRLRLVILTLGAICGGAVAGCRPQFLLYELLMFIVLLGIIVKRQIGQRENGQRVVRERITAERITAERTTGVRIAGERISDERKNGERITGEKEEKGAVKISWAEVVAVALPYLLLGCIVFGYNMARFGSGFDFGATYSLTTNDMNHRGFSLPRMIQGIYCFMFQPADIRPVFPYVFKPQIDFGLMSRDLSEYTFGGMLTNIMFLWPVFILPWLRKKDRALGKLMPLGFVLCSVIICAFDANSAGVLQRYMTDGVWGFWIAAVCAWITMSGLIENASAKKKKIFAGVFVLALTTTILYSCCIMFAFGDANSLINTNPKLYYTVGSWFG